MKYSTNFERDYEWYLKYKHIFTFDGNVNTKDKVVFSETGKSAKECFYVFDSQGKIIPTNEPELLFELHKCKGSINFNIKMWVEGISEGTFVISEFINEYELLQWMIKAIENQLKKSMADITMCKGNECSLKESCKRFLLIPNSYYQSYFSEIPYNKEKEKCDEYWEIINDKTKKT